MIRRICLFNLLVALVLLGAFGTAIASAASPAWRVLAVTGPTHLPPVSDEVQRISVDAEGGTFTLGFAAQTTSVLDFDASAVEVEAALNALPSINGSVEVEGGPGDAFATHPYFVHFGGAFAASNVPTQITADSSQLTGSAHTATVSTKTQGGTAGKGEIGIVITNVGGAPSNGTPITAEFELPAGITPITGSECPVTGQKVTCSRTIVVQSARSMASFLVPLTIGSSAPASSSAEVTVKGGGGTELKTQMPILVSAVPAPPGVQAVWAGAFDENGSLLTDAGAHPNSAGAGFHLNTVLSPSGTIIPAGDLRNLNVDLPPGFIGNPLVTPRCPQDNLGGCTGADVGWAAPAIQVFGTGFGEPNRLVNGKPPSGYAAEFTFKLFQTKVNVLGSLRSDQDYGVTVTAFNVPTVYKVYGAINVLEGEPATSAGKAFLTNPTDCSQIAPLTVLSGDVWNVPSLLDGLSTGVPAVTKCDQLDFDPDFTFQPAATQAASVTGATADLSIDQEGLLDPAKLAPAHLKRSVVTLPVGMTLNPSAADGLKACSTQQIGLKGTNFAAPNPIRFDMSHPTCPDASKIGTAEIETPLLEDPLEGTVYLAAQDDNPFHSLLAMYLVVDDAKTGTVVKLPGEVKPDSQTGQLTAVFDNNPQVPFEDLKLRFRGGGPRSTLATPDVCGKYTTTTQFSPWSAADPNHPTAAEMATPDDSFSVSTGVGGSAACPQTKAQRPFSLGFEAGSTNPVAGAHSPFTLRITRPDGNQELDKITVVTPPGFTATLKGVSICSASAVAAAAAAGRTGAQELASPSCPASSQVGTTTIGAGVGSQPLYVKTGKVYLAGPYKGAPASLAFIVPAVAGPFDLGVQVVRTALKLNPKTGQVTAESDAIPQILKGIPLLIREVRVDLDRPNFTLNPTNCEVMAINGTVTGGSGAVANLGNRFQVGNCRALKFKPDLKIQLHGGTKRGDYQRLSATVTYPKGSGYANIASAAVTLPHSNFLAQEHIRTVCTRVQFAAHSCPKGSIYGHAVATTPLLDGKLKGPVYLRSSDNLLPDLVVALRGPDAQPIEVELAGRTDSKNGGIRNTFDVVPDAPVSRFTLSLQGGKKSLIVNSRDLCKGTQRATVRMSAHNGKTRNFRPVVGNDCGSKKGKKTKRATAKKHGRLGGFGPLW